jgi:hypothetical protein
MISNLLFYQLLLVGCLWLCLMLHVVGHTAVLHLPRPHLSWFYTTCTITFTYRMPAYVSLCHSPSPPRAQVRPSRGGPERSRWQLD